MNTLAIDPDMPATLYAGTDSGVFKSTDGAGTWGTLNTGLPHADGFVLIVFVLAIDPSMPGRLYAGTKTPAACILSCRLHAATASWTRRAM